MDDHFHVSNAPDILCISHIKFVSSLCSCNFAHFSLLPKLLVLLLELLKLFFIFFLVEHLENEFIYERLLDHLFSSYIMSADRTHLKINI